MKYILMCIAALAICLGVSGGVIALLGKKKHFKFGTKMLLTLAVSVLLICAVTVGYLSVYYHADQSSYVTSESLKVEKIDGGFFFDGPGKKSALIFYPGAKVETYAYAALMTGLAEEGVDCFLADMPFRMAFFGSKLADRFMDVYEYENWSVAGHSMGGLVISGYAADHADKINHLILLASYPGGPVPDGISLCSIYGTKDGCLNLKAYENAKSYWPANATECVIEGGNHAQYANYGPQSGDFEAEITREEQQRITVESMIQEICG